MSRPSASGPSMARRRSFDVSQPTKMELEGHLKAFDSEAEKAKASATAAAIEFGAFGLLEHEKLQKLRFSVKNPAVSRPPSASGAGRSSVTQEPGAGDLAVAATLAAAATSASHPSPRVAVPPSAAVPEWPASATIVVEKLEKHQLQLQRSLRVSYCRQDTAVHNKLAIPVGGSTPRGLFDRTH
eukprot:2120516-Prymnesium_polylepis.1